MGGLIREEAQPSGGLEPSSEMKQAELCVPGGDEPQFSYNSCW